MKSSVTLFEVNVFGIDYMVRTIPSLDNKICLVAFDGMELIANWNFPYDSKIGIIWPTEIIDAGDDEICIEARNTIDKMFKLKAFW